MSDSSDAWFDVALARARTGEAVGLDALVRHLDERLVGFARARGADDPEGLADEVLVQMCRSISDFSGNLAQFRAWVFTIARNRLVDERRRMARRVDTRPVEPGLLPEDTRVDDALERVGEQERIDDLLSTLTDDQRDVVVLRVVAGLSVAETAEVLGRRQGAVRALQHRALGHLRARLTEDAGRNGE